MGDRLVAYEREDGTYTVHETVDGIDLPALAGGLTHETPFGGPDRHNLWARMAIEALRWGDTAHLEHLLAQSERPRTAVRVEPVATGVGFDELRYERLDYRRVDALLVVSRTFSVDAYRAVWLAFDDVHVGALVPIRWLAGRTTRERCFPGAFAALRVAVATLRADCSSDAVAHALERGLRALVDDPVAIIVTRPRVEGAT